MGLRVALGPPAEDGLNVLTYKAPARTKRSVSTDRRHFNVERRSFYEAKHRSAYTTADKRK